jgi:hypothetical protein
MPTSKRNTQNGGRGKRNRRISRKSRPSHSSRNTSLKELGIAGSIVGAAAITQGSELQEHNQNQNQQQQEDLMFIGGGGVGGVGGRKPGCGNDIADHILCFLELLNTIKIYHWTTLSYPTHKATDELHGKISTLVDSFIEIYIGHCSRGKGAGAGLPVFRFRTAKDACISFCECKSLDVFCKVLDDNIIHLEGLTKKLDGYTDLVNIRDEMVGALAHALYLLRLK